MHRKNMDPLIRHSAPSKLDEAPFQTECLVYLDGHVWDLYIQYSNNEQDPRWEYMGRKVIDNESENRKIQQS